MQQITRNMIVAAPNGGELHVVNEDGEVVQSFAVEAGRHRASFWYDLIGPDEVLTPGDGVTCFSGRPARSGFTVIQHPDHYRSDANPDFQPLGQAEKLVQRMEQALRHMSAQNKANAARIAAALRLEAIPVAPAAAPAVQDEPGAAGGQ